ncbi:MAG TPA: hypothetical protein DHV36_06515 [Desulfobacteraceae bacterium]|nr:hypothetical protein [Desulfobacteraceae bacterium]
MYFSCIFFTPDICQGLMSGTAQISWLQAFDMKTLALVFLMVLYISAYVMTAAWRMGRGRFRGVGAFVGYFVLMAAGVSLALLKGVLPELICVAAANTLMIAGNVMLAAGMAQFLGLRMAMGSFTTFLPVFLSVFFLVYTWFTLGSPDVRMRIMIFSGAIIAILSYILFMVFFRASPDHRRYAFNTGITLLLFLFVYLIRFFLAVFSGGAADYYTPALPDHLLQAASLALILLLSHSLHLMINARLVNLARRQAKAQEVLACQDELTSLYNRRKLNEVMSAEYSRFRRHGRPFSLIICDIDHFKRINDTWGHDAGDQALIRVAQRLDANIRAEDVAGRWGGEEFLILLPETVLADACGVAEKLRGIFSTPVSGADFVPSIDIRLSFGVAQVREADDLATVIKHADTGSYRAKEKGRNRVETYERTDDRL